MLIKLIIYFACFLGVCGCNNFDDMKEITIPKGRTFNYECNFKDLGIDFQTAEINIQSVINLSLIYVNITANFKKKIDSYIIINDRTEGAIYDVKSDYKTMDVEIECIESSKEYCQINIFEDYQYQIKTWVIVVLILIGVITFIACIITVMYQIDVCREYFYRSYRRRFGYQDLDDD